MCMTTDDSSTNPNPVTEYDSPWKDILQRYFKEFMQFFFKSAYSQIDWTRKPEFLDKELQQITRQAEIGLRFADKLVKVYSRDGEENWLLIHAEVQAQEEFVFPKRMYTYNYRIFDLYDQPVASLAILGDDNENWRPSKFSRNLFGCSVYFRFPVVKLLDYSQKLPQLEKSRNPFATVVMAHLIAKQTTNNRTERKQQKLALVKRLYQLKLKREDIVSLFEFIDWMLTLPPNLDKEFWQEYSSFEESKRMKYVTSVERIGIEKGIEQGKQQEALFLIRRLLNRRLGNIDNTLIKRVDELPLPDLETLGEDLLDFTSVTDLINWLQTR